MRLGLTTFSTEPTTTSRNSIAYVAWSHFSLSVPKRIYSIDVSMELTARQVAELYKNRWQIELFFKWLKQHLKIKKFWGTTENAVRIQIYAAIYAYCLVAIVQHEMKSERSTYEVLQIPCMSLTDTTPLKDFFNKTIFKNDKERSGSSESNLFNF